MIPHLFAGFVDCLFTVGSIFTIAWEAGLRLKFRIAEEIFDSVFWFRCLKWFGFLKWFVFLVSMLKWFGFFDFDVKMIRFFGFDVKMIRFLIFEFDIYPRFRTLISSSLGSGWVRLRSGVFRSRPFTLKLPDSRKWHMCRIVIRILGFWWLNLHWNFDVKNESVFWFRC